MDFTIWCRRLWIWCGRIIIGVITIVTRTDEEATAGQHCQKEISHFTIR